MSTQYLYIWPKNTEIKTILKQLLELEFLPYVCFIGQVGSIEMQYMAENQVWLDNFEKAYTEEEYDKAMIVEMKHLKPYYERYCVLLVSKVEIKGAKLFYWY